MNCIVESVAPMFAGGGGAGVSCDELGGLKYISQGVTEVRVVTNGF
jgi:hypothetical protein